MDSHLTATEAAQSFSEILNRIRSGGETFVVERGGQPVCRIVPVGPAQCTVSDLRKLLEGAPHPDAEFLDEVDELARAQPTLPAGPWES
jgi:antitoxin (DNA-binding transcriptional repressor) of toxin-antitoxin stability system